MASMPRFSNEHLRRPWGRHPVPDGETVTVEVGPLELQFRSREGELQLSHRLAEEDSEPTDGGPTDPPEEAEWSRWAVGDRAADGVLLHPRLPDRTVVVRPEQAFHVLPDARARVYVRVPLWVEISLPDGGGTLTEVPTVRLSDTWWGDFTAGELCYFLPTSARRAMDPDDFLDHLAVATLDLRNRSVEELAVEKLALRVPHLSLFAEERGLWADVTVASYRGEDEGSDLDMTGKAPEEASDARPVVAPRIPLARGFRARTFARLRGLGAAG